MRVYDFKLVLTGVAEVSDAQADALVDAGCDDGTIVSRDGLSFIRFSRESASLEEAINSAARDVTAAGLAVGHIEVATPV